MNPSISKPISYWIDSTPESVFPPLHGDLKVDVAIVGSGIAGMTTAANNTSLCGLPPIERVPMKMECCC